jgi:hypothetical protein
MTWKHIESSPLLASLICLSVDFFLSFSFADVVIRVAMKKACGRAGRAEKCLPKASTRAFHVPISEIFLSLLSASGLRTNKWNVKWLVRQVDIKTKLIFVVFFRVHYVSPVDAFNKMFSFSVSTSSSPSPELRPRPCSNQPKRDSFFVCFPFFFLLSEEADDDTELIEPERGER